MWHFLEVALDGFGVPMLQKAFGWLLRPKPTDHRIAALLEPSPHVFYVDVPFPPIPDSVKITKPSPDDIHNEIDSRPVFQRTEAARAYRGLEVCWPGLFRDVRPFAKECVVKVKYRNPAKHSSVEISCNAALAPRLKIAKANDPVIIRGVIVNVEGFSIWLGDAVVEFVY
jgi:hypothetical protein